MDEDIFAPKIKEECSFYEALELLAFDYYPVDDENLLNVKRIRYPHFFYDVNYNDINEDLEYVGYYRFKVGTSTYIVDEEELFYYQSLQKAFSFLNRLILLGKVSVRGYIHSMGGEDIPFPDGWTDIKQVRFYTSSASGVYYRTMALINPNKLYDSSISLSFSTLEIQKYAKIAREKIEQSKSYCKNNSLNKINDTSIDARGRGYSTPYLDIINEMIAEGRISKEDQRTIKELASEIIEKGKQHNIVITKTLAGNMATIMRTPESQLGGIKKNKQR